MHDTRVRGSFYHNGIYFASPSGEELTENVWKLKPVKKYLEGHTQIFHNQCSQLKPVRRCPMGGV